MVEDLGLARLGRGDQVLVKDLEDVLADLGELGLDLLAVLLDESDLRRVALGLLLLFDGGDYSPRGTAGADDVLVGDGEKVTLLNSQIAVLRGNDLHVLDHLCKAQHMLATRANMGRVNFLFAQTARRTFVALSLLSELGEVDSIIVSHFGGKLSIVYCVSMFASGKIGGVMMR